MGTYHKMLRWGLGLLLVGLVASGQEVWAGFDEDSPEVLRKTAEQGNVHAQTILGLTYYLGEKVPQDYDQAVLWLRRAAEQGEAAAQFLLGTMYNNGRGVPQDYAQAVRWYRQAAEQGNPEAQNNLGRLYNSGRGIPQDYTQALLWYSKAAAQGVAAAQFNLGLMYALGGGVPQDYTQAYFWYNLAAARFPTGADREKAARARERTAAQLTPVQLAAAQARARAWQPAPETPDIQAAGTLPLSVDAPAHVSGAFPRQHLIRQVQQRLQAGGFTPGAIDGAMGPQTQQALRWFQHSQGLLATGELDERTLDALGAR